MFRPDILYVHIQDLKKILFNWK